MNINRLIRSSGFRFSAFYTLIFVLSLLVLLLTLYWTISWVLQQQLHDLVESELQSLVETYDSEGAAELWREVDEKHIISPEIGGAYFLVRPGAQPVGNIPVASRIEGWQALPPVADPGAARDDRDDDHQFVGLGRSFPDGSYLFVGTDAYPMLTFQETILNAFGLTALIGVVLGLFGGLFLSHSLLKQVDAITSTSRAIMRGDLKQRIPIRGTSDEIDRLSASLNEMLDRIQLLMEGLTHVSSNIAHDLRTPLSRLRQQLESALTHAKRVPDFRRAIEDSILEADTLLATFSALLRIANIEAGNRQVAFQPLSLRKLVANIAEAYGAVAEESGRPFAAEITTDAEFVGDVELLTQMLANIVENAIRHTPVASPIDVALKSDDDGALITIADRGAGIPAEERARVFERFYRLNRSRSTPGCGLGLALVAAVAELHGIAISLKDNSPGLRVELMFRRKLT